MSKVILIERNGADAHYWLGPVGVHIFRERSENGAGRVFNRAIFAVAPSTRLYLRAILNHVSRLRRRYSIAGLVEIARQSGLIRID